MPSWACKPRLDRETLISAYIIYSLLVIALAVFGLFVALALL